jgi:type I restriction enzyme S subunit
VKPYPCYAQYFQRPGNLNIPWLTNLPANWKVIRSKRLFDTRKERARPDDEQLSATQAYGVIPQKEFEKRVGRKVVQITQHLDKRAHVEPDDFVISMRSFQGGLERAWARGCIRSSYVVLKPSPEADIGYFAHLFKCQDYIGALQATANFIRDGQDLSFSNFCLVDLPLPPKEDQQQIARYLDWQTAKINKFIKAKKKLIALLKEQKQHIINAAVTKGINPNVKMKDSGVEWLGEIPEHWNAVRLKTCITKIEQGWSPQCEAQKAGINDWGVLKVGCVNGDYFKASENKKLPSSLEPRFQHLVKKEDIIVSRANTKELVGLAAVADKDYPNIFLCDKLCRFQAKPDITIAKFLVYVIRSLVSREQIEEKTSGASSSMQNISQSVIRNLNIALPPKEEQWAIVGFIEKETGLIERTIARTEREIELIQEYRTRLVSDVVTGKVDVRNVVIPDFEPVEADADSTDEDETEDEPMIEESDA